MGGESSLSQRATVKDGAGELRVRSPCRLKKESRKRLRYLYSPFRRTLGSVPPSLPSFSSILIPSSPTIRIPPWGCGKLSSIGFGGEIRESLGSFTRISRKTDCSFLDSNFVLKLG